MKKLSWVAPIFLSLLSSSCDEAPVGKVPVGVDPEGERGVRFATVSSDYSVASISLLDARGELVSDDYMNSGTVPSGLVAFLSGDVALPEHSGEDGVLVILDRYLTDVITRVRLADGKVLGQVRTHSDDAERGTTSFSSNPQDYVRVSDDTAWVSRFEPNINPRVADIDRANDLLRIDPERMQRSQERIDLWPLNGTETRRDPGTGKESQVEVFARPGAMLRLGDTLVVGLSRLSLDFKTVGTGMLALVDLETRRVVGVDLPGLKNCGSVGAVPGDDQAALVSCLGDYVSPDEPSAGLAIVRVDGLGANIEHLVVFEPGELPPVSGALSLGGSIVVASVDDFAGEASDVLTWLDLASGERREIASVTPGQGAFGAATFDPAQGLLLVPDASLNGDRKPTGGLRRFSLGDDGSFEELRMVTISKATFLPTRQVSPL